MASVRENLNRQFDTAKGRILGRRGNSYEQPVCIIPSAEHKDPIIEKTPEEIFKEKQEAILIKEQRLTEMMLEEGITCVLKPKSGGRRHKIVSSTKEVNPFES